MSCFIFSAVAFYPGQLTPDSVYQLQQAKGLEVLTDWHQPGMALFWRFLIFTTGEVSSLLYFQLLVYWLAFGILAICVRVRSGKLSLGLAPLLFAALPTSHIISGIFTKDVLMAAVLCLVATLLYLSSYLSHRTKLALFLFIATIVLIVFAGNLRYNVLPALMPLAYAASNNYFSNNRKTLLATVAIMLTVQASITSVGWIFNVVHSRGQLAILVDDIKSLLTEDEILASNMNSDTKKYVIEVKRDCSNKGLLVNSTFMCGDVTGFRSLASKDYDNVLYAWASAVQEKPIGAITLRAKIFWNFITKYEPFTSEKIKNEARLFSAYTPDNDLGFFYLRPELVQSIIGGGNSSFFGNVANSYSGISQSEFKFMYRPLFWIVILCALIYYHRVRLSRVTHTYSAMAILSSGAIYLLTYFPLATANNYRFIYWSVLSIGIASTIFIAEYNNSKNNLRSVILQDTSKPTNKTHA